MKKYIIQTKMIEHPIIEVDATDYKYSISTDTYNFNIYDKEVMLIARDIVIYIKISEL